MLICEVMSLESMCMFSINVANLQQYLHSVFYLLFAVSSMSQQRQDIDDESEATALVCFQK